MTPTPNPTAEQIVEEALNRIDLYADEMPKAVVSALRAHNLLSEGAPSEEQIERALDALSRFNQWTDNPRGAMRAALTAAGVAPQEPPALDPVKVAEWFGSDEPRKSRDETYGQYDRRRARALCEAYTEGKLS